MAKYLKTLDANHLVTTGEDGFYSTTTSRFDINPGFEQGMLLHCNIFFDTAHSVSAWSQLDKRYQQPILIAPGRILGMPYLPLFKLPCWSCPFEISSQTICC